MKFTIRFSILTILLILLLGTSLCIVGIHYSVLDNILIKTAKDSMSHASGEVSEQVARYLEPLDQRSYIAANLIDREVVKPSPTPTFVKFLHRFLVGETNISSVYWADALGNLYMLEWLEDDRFANVNILNPEGDRKIIENIYDFKMNLISSKERLGIDFDPRLRPWYQLAKFKKQYSWFVYPMAHHVDVTRTELGVTAAYPIYDKQGEFKGVFGIDLPLEAISSFVKNISITENSIIFVCDDDGNLFSAYNEQARLLEDYKMPKIKDLGMDWVLLSYNIYRQKNQPLFVFEYDDDQYIAAYDSIPDVKGGRWSVAIVTPVNDIIAPLKKTILFSFILVAVALVICIILAVLFASRISQPIVKLAKDAELICQLKLQGIKRLFSRIKEIDFMAGRFIKMKNALNSFQRYMPVSLVRNLILSGKVAEVGGEMKEMTLLFSDIEDFTLIAENMPPPKVMRYLSEYFQVATEVILNNNGAIDKYIGDGVMALWGAPIEDPDHALHACKAVLQIRKNLDDLNEKWRREGSPEVNTRIGIGTSKVVVGNVGSDERLNYTALGDGVNLASRLENLNKEYGTYTIVSEETYNQVKDYFRFRLIDKVAVRGRTKGTLVYELLGEKTGIKDEKLEKYNQDFQKAFTLYEKGLWQEALELFLKLAKDNPEDQLLKIFIKRCQKFHKNPPKEWDGTWVMG